MSGQRVLVIKLTVEEYEQIVVSGHRRTNKPCQDAPGRDISIEGGRYAGIPPAAHARASPR